MLLLRPPHPLPTHITVRRAYTTGQYLKRPSTMPSSASRVLSVEDLHTSEAK